MRAALKGKQSKWAILCSTSCESSVTTKHSLTQYDCNICRRTGSGSNKIRDKYRICAYTCVSHTYYPLSCPLTSSTPLFFSVRAVQLNGGMTGLKWKTGRAEVREGGSGRMGMTRRGEKDDVYNSWLRVQEVENLHHLGYYYSVCSLYIDVLVTLTSTPQIPAGTNINANQNEPIPRRHADPTNATASNQ